MRIAYIALYQGPSLQKRRPSLRNTSLSRQLKIELVAASLRANFHEVEIISQGEVIEHQYGFYPGFAESQLFHPSIPVYYASALAIPRLNGLWSSLRTLRLFTARHRVSPYDLVIIWNLKNPQVRCAKYAIQKLGLPVVLGYEDDEFVTRSGEPRDDGLLTRYRDNSRRRLLKTISGCMAVSPHLLSQVPDEIPKMLLRGAVGDDIVKASRQPREGKRNWVLFAGTHGPTNGIAQLIEAWRTIRLPEWELHITGHGETTDALRKLAKNIAGLHFHGLVSRQELVELMASAKICINPHVISQTPGSLFAFKIIEYLAAGAMVITTPMGSLEKELEAGITYMPDNSPETIAATIHEVIRERAYQRMAAEAAQQMYGEAAVSRSLDSLLRAVRVQKSERSHRTAPRTTANTVLR